MGGETCHCTHLALHCLSSVTLEGGYDKVRTPRSRGFGLIRSALTRPRSGLDALRSSTRKKGQHGTGLRVISPSHPRRHHGVQGWPSIPRARRYSHLYRDRRNITSRTPRRPGLLSPYKRAGQGSPRGRTKNQNNRNRQQVTPREQSNHLVFFFSLLRPGLTALSRKLVTPTQAPRCKEIQISPPRWT
jgi:hypothetical protein